MMVYNTINGVLGIKALVTRSYHDDAALQEPPLGRYNPTRAFASTIINS
jgi:hypothetical protein